ncbi:MAG: integration host factor subunit alpha [Candidatus Gastranaerophilales bacterium]|nr:integration host factor subunit alpha [Candidatus Gastranaerophilales bacterium]
MKSKSGRALTREALQESIFTNCAGRLSRAAARDILEMFFEEIFEALERGESVLLYSFGSFDVRSKRARPGRNPKTGAEATIVARKVVRFRPSRTLIARINGATVAEDDGRARPAAVSTAPQALRSAQGGDGRDTQ